MRPAPDRGQKNNGHIDRSDDNAGASPSEIVFTYIIGVTYTFGSCPVIVVRFVSSVVGFLPGLKGRGIHLVPPVNRWENIARRHPPHVSVVVDDSW